MQGAGPHPIPDQIGVLMKNSGRTDAERAVIDRLHKLQLILPAMAQEAATARREAARLRIENSRLAYRLAEFESRADFVLVEASGGPGQLRDLASPQLVI
jgi:dethiobiotin synthetase